MCIGFIGPYSNFRVGCAILLNNGTVVLGANMENASYPVGTCAERVALGNALVNAGMQRGDIKAVAVTSDIEEGAPGAPCTPCGMCRQALREICDVSMTISQGSYDPWNSEEKPVLMSRDSHQYRSSCIIPMETIL